MENVETLERLRKIEVITDKLRSEMDDVLWSAYQAAVAAQDEDSAAMLARKIRDNLLAETDSTCTLDRMLPEAPSGTIFTSWLPWLRDLAAVRTNAWGIYRQDLRDITAQPGWPLNIDWPKSPEEQDGEPV